LATLALALSVRACPAAPAAPPPLVRVAVADWVVSGDNQPRGWLGYVYSETLARRLRLASQFMIIDPLELRGARGALMPRDIDGVVDQMRAMLPTVDADYILSGLIEDRGERLRVTCAVLARASGRPLVAPPLDVNLDGLLQTQLEVVVNQFLSRHMGARFTNESYKGLKDYQVGSSWKVLEMVGRGWKAWSPDNPEPALDRWREALAADAKCDLAAEALTAATLLYRRQLLDSVRAGAERNVKAHPLSAEAYYQLAEVYFDAGQLKDAITEYAQAVNLRRNYVQAYLGWGVSDYLLNQFDKAVDAFDAVLALDPHNVKALYNKGLCLDARGQRADARNLWTAALKFHPADPLLLAALEATQGNGPPLVPSLTPPPVGSASTPRPGEPSLPGPPSGAPAPDALPGQPGA
jgi:TolB-like protein/uncharacterized protein (DUF2164 family)